MEQNYRPQTNPLAIASLVSALVAWGVGGLGSCALFFLFAPLSICTWLVFLIGNIAAVATGHLSQNEIRNSGDGGQGLALTGTVLGWIGVGLNVLPICLAPVVIVLLALMGPAISNVYSNITINL